MADFPHPSRPGFYATTFDEDLKAALGVLVAALLPGGDGYPSGTDAQVVEFIESRSSKLDREAAAGIVSRCAHDSVDSAAESLRLLEKEDPVRFAWLCEFAYHGYYASRRVLAAMSDRGYDYHGAPQPLGYLVTEEMLVPSARRGSFIATEEVAPVQDR